MPHFGESFGDPSAIPTFIVSGFAARHVKVALSGDGGDEIFADYASFAAMERGRVCGHVPRAVRGLRGRLAEWLPYAAYSKYFLRARLLKPDWMLPAEGAYLERALSDCLLPDSSGILFPAMYFEATANLTGDMLVKVDRMSMASSLDVRSPLH